MDLGQLLNDFTQTAGAIYGTVRPPTQTLAATTPAPTSTASNWKSYLPLGIGAVVLLVIVIVATRKG